jgi:hypothetical protein
VIRITGRYHDQKVELDQPLNLPDGTEVELEIYPARDEQEEGWADLGMSRLEAEWDNAQDAIYDDWKRLYGVSSR